MTSPQSVAEVLTNLGLEHEDLVAWQQSGLGSDAFEDWVTDRVARRPEGRRAREVYGADDVHDFARRAILEALTLRRDDHLLDVGCGGGLLLRDALGTGASATGIDHSADMVSLARQRAPAATVQQASAQRMPFSDSSFTAVAMSVVFFFLPDPVAVLRECDRVLVREGRLAIYTTAPELRGTPAAPEPIASRGHFYTDDALVQLARRAGLTRAQVVNDYGGQLLTARV